MRAITDQTYGLMALAPSQKGPSHV
jgi:hypothetical protein